MPRIDLSPVVRFLIGTAAVGVTLLAMRAGALVVNSVVLALVIAICFVPLMRWLQKKMPSGVALVITLLAVFGLIIFVTLFLWLSFSNLIRTLPTYVGGAEVRLVETTESIAEAGIDFELTIPEWLEPAGFFSFAANLITGFINQIYQVGFMLLLTAFMLWEALILPGKAAKVFSPDHPLRQRFAEFNTNIKQYVYITAQTGIIAGIGDIILLFILGVDFPILWGVLSAILSFIPSIGFILAVIPPMVLAFVQFGWVQALIVLLGYWLINGVVENIIKPRLIGEGLDLSPLVVILSLFVFGWTLGIIGGLLSIPLVIIVRTFILDAHDSTRWLSEMMMAERKLS